MVCPYLSPHLTGETVPINHHLFGDDENLSRAMNRKEGYFTKNPRDYF